MCFIHNRSRKIKNGGLRNKPNKNIKMANEKALKICMRINILP